MKEVTPGDISTSLGQCLKRRRLTQRLRLIDVSRRAGLSVPTIRAIERGDNSVSFGNYAYVAVMLGAGDLFRSIIEEAETHSSMHRHSRVRFPNRKRTP
jgi:transcriptional regulator with XRE-family HTH domain